MSDTKEDKSVEELLPVGQFLPSELMNENPETETRTPHSPPVTSNGDGHPKTLSSQLEEIDPMNVNLTPTEADQQSSKTHQDGADDKSDSSTEYQDTINNGSNNTSGCVEEVPYNKDGGLDSSQETANGLLEGENTTVLANESVAESPNEGDGTSDSAYQDTTSDCDNKDANTTLHANGSVDEHMANTEMDRSDSSTQYQDTAESHEEVNETLHNKESVEETLNERDENLVTTPTSQYPMFSSHTSPEKVSPVSLNFEFDRPRDTCIKIVLPNTHDCPVYALVLCSWDNILGPNAQYVWGTEQKHGFTPDMLNYLSTHTLTSSDQPENTVDTKMLILKERGILVTSFLFSGYDGIEKTVFSLSLIVPYVECQWYLPLHEFCVSRLSMMIGKLRVLQDKHKEEVGELAIKSFNEDVPKFIGVLTLLKTSSPGPTIQLSDTVFAAGLDNTLDVQFTRLAIASHLQTCGCTIVIGNSVSDINMMISTLAMFLSPGERRGCIYLTEEEERLYEKDLYLQGFLKDHINLSECMREVMVSSYPSTLVDMVTLEVRQMLPYNEHAYWRHEVLCHELQSLWLDSQEPMVYLPIVTFQNKCETETLVQNFQREINLLHPRSGVREAYIEQFQRLLDRKAVGLIKYVEEETMRGSKTSRITIKKLKHDLDLNPEGNFRIILARAEKLKPGIFTIVCGNPAQMKDPSLQELPMT
ncbi:guanine nucleotide exchange factor C9orf72-like [Amphiura filiformis]|uniref:guanine nucleotide exchange factor C9orf72-like n=1 Tax=Amphiura filiformis TaxID=82378 RepID=UPI003B20B98D